MKPRRLGRSGVKTVVVDAWAVVAWLKDERPASEQVARLLERSAAGSVRVYLSAINAGEVYYSLVKEGKPDLGSRFRNLLPSMPVTTVVPDLDAISLAAEWKAKAQISYADGFAVALAAQTGAILFTGDPELKSVLPAAKIQWLQRNKKK